MCETPSVMSCTVIGHRDHRWICFSCVDIQVSSSFVISWHFLFWKYWKDRVYFVSKT